MMKFLTGLMLVASALFVTPAFAQAGPPADIGVMRVTVGQLANDQTVFITTTAGNSVRISVSGCDENWKTGEEFLLIKGRNGSFSLICSIRFFHYYNQNKNWDAAIQAVARDGALCTAASTN